MTVTKPLRRADRALRGTQQRAGRRVGQPDSSGAVQEPSAYYPYTLDGPNAVKTVVMADAAVSRI